MNDPFVGTPSETKSEEVLNICQYFPCHERYKRLTLNTKMQVKASIAISPTDSVSSGAVLGDAFTYYEHQQCRDLQPQRQ
jgi:hypothetical protein